MSRQPLHSIIAGLLLGMCTACQSDGEPAYTVGEADNPVRLCSGILQSPEAQVARAETSPTTSPLTPGTAVQLYVEGTWAGKGNGGTLIHTPVCAAGAEASTPLRYTDKFLYWDDYGTGDPNNTEGREQGLNIYALAIDGQRALPADLTTWVTNNWTTPLPWSVATDGTKVLHQDLLVANNLSDEATPGGNRLKFDARDQNQLQFRHVLSKITFRLTAGKGFEDKQFAAAPEVKLTRNQANESTLPEYALSEGTIHVPTATASATPGSASVIIAEPTQTDETDGEGRQVVTEEALLYPGSVLGSNDTDLLARINADDNIYYVTAEKIRAAITALGSGQENEFQTQPGYNYVIRVTVHKTDVEVTASVTHWTDIEAAEEAPVINVSTSISKPGDGGSNDGLTAFDFYLSEDRTSGYGTLNGDTYTPNAVPTGTADGSSRWNFNTNVQYWPNHQTHYHFRGVYPTSTEVVKVAEDGTQGIKVGNGPYDAGTFPSNLLVGMPEITSGTMCQNADHPSVDMSTEGICATEGTINLNFRYPMAQVKVKLTTTEQGSHNHVNIGANTEVALVNVHTTGQVLLGTRKVEPTGSAGEYKLDAVTGQDLERHSIIVPQPLTFSTAGAATNLRFRIKVTNTDSTTDTYYADVQPIPVKVSGSDAAAAPVDQWKSGQAYVYTLKLTKTEIKVSASLTDWTAVEGETDVWF